MAAVVLSVLLSDRRPDGLRMEKAEPESHDDGFQ